MSSKFYEIDLLQKYRQTISKRYRGYNRVHKLDINKLNENPRSVNQFQPASELKQSKKCKSPLIQIAKACFLQSHYRQQYQQQTGIIIKSTNAPLNLKQTKAEAQFNNRKFIKKKVLNINHLQNLIFPNSQQNDGPTYKKCESNTRIKNSSEEILENNKFKHRKKLGKDSNKYINIEEGQKVLSNLQSLRFQPFSPIIKGEKKRTHYVNNTKSKTYENQTLVKDQQIYQKRSKNLTNLQRQKLEYIQHRLKRNNSYISQKSDGQANKSSSLSNSVEPNKFLKKFSSNFQSSKLSTKQKIVPSNVAFPKISCDKQAITKTNLYTHSSNQLEAQNSTTYNKKSLMDLQIQKNIQKYKKTPCLLKYPFDVKNIQTESYIVVEAESQVILWGYRSSSPYEIASLTKIMTFWVVLKLIQQYNIDPKIQNVQVQNKQSNIGGTSAELFSGQIYSLQNLFYALMLPSGNDAALTLAAWGGKFQASNPQDAQCCINQFVKLMNQEAKNLNLIDTRFGNPHGLPHKMARSTAFDIAKLCIVCMKNETFRKVVKCKSYKCSANMINGKKRINQWENTNKLLRRQGFIGIKTGITITAGPCLASAYKFRGKTYISVLLRCKKISRRFKQTRKILHWCLNKRYEQSLTEDQICCLKKLKRNNAQLDSDYSDQQNQFRYDRNNSKQLRKRCDIISEM